MNQNAPKGICFINKLSGGYTSGPPHKSEGIQEKQQGRDKKEVKGQNRERRGNRKRVKGEDGIRGASKGEGARRGAVQPYYFLGRVDAYNISLCQRQSLWLRSRTVTVSYVTKIKCFQFPAI
jgi:hypothetical protein